jgi:hypothetical protein
MSRYRVKSCPLKLAVLVVGVAALATADELNKKTIVTFSGPVEIPGKVLPAGTYVFKLLDSTSNRNIVQIYDKDEKQLYATVLALPDYRQNPTGDTVIRFEERAAGTPEAIRVWFYPGDLYGVQFVYPHDEAASIAKRTHQNVLSMSNEMQQNMNSPVKSADDPNSRAMQKAEVSGVSPSGDQVDAGQVVNSKPKK